MWKIMFLQQLNEKVSISKKLSEEDKKVIKHLNTKLQSGVEIEELDNPISSDEILLRARSYY